MRSSSVARWRARLGALLAVVTAASVVSLAPPAAAATASFTRTYASVAPSPLGAYNADRYGQRHNTYSSPAVGDVTGDGVLDLVVGAPNGVLYVYRAPDGALQRTIPVDVGIITSTPSLTDLNDDGRLDIVVGIMPSDEATAARTIGGFDGLTGAVLFSKRTCRAVGKPCNVFSTIAIGDVDSDGDEDLVATSQDHFLHAWRDDGRYLPGFPVYVYDTSWSSPSLVDLDGDGTVEIVTITDLDAGNCADNPPAGCPPDAFGSRVRVVEWNGVVSDSRIIQGEITISSPAVGDITGDGRPEIAFTSGSCFRFGCGVGATGGAERRLTVLDQNLDLVFQRDLRNAAQTSPAILNIDEGIVELAVTDNEGWLYVYDAAGNRVWETCGRNDTSACRSDIAGSTPSIGTDASPVAADVDNDGVPEIVFQGESTLRVYDGATGAVEYQYALYGDPLPMGNQVSTPTVFSMGGATRIAYHVLFDQGAVGRDADDHDGMFLFTGTTALGGSSWPAFRGDARAHQGSQGTLPRVDVPTSVEGRFIAKAYLDLLGRAVSAEDQRAWFSYVRNYGAAAFVRQLVFAPTCEWPREVVRRLYVDILGRDPDTGGLAFWSGRVCAGTRARDVASSIYGSPEYFQDPEQGGATNHTYVLELYDDILDRDPDVGGLAYWESEVARRGGVGPGTSSVAFDFYQSPESRRRRVCSQYRYLLRRNPDAGGVNYWAGVLLGVDDLQLTVSLASSSEYVNAPFKAPLEPCSPSA